MNELDHEVAAIRAAYLSIASQPPETWYRSLGWLHARMTSDMRDGKKAAFAVARFARKVGRLSEHERQAA